MTWPTISWKHVAIFAAIVAWLRRLSLGAPRLISFRSRLGHRIMNGPSVPQAIIKQALTCASQPADFRNRSRRPGPFKHHGGPLASILLVHCRPSTILKAIRSVVIDAVESRAIWPPTHIFNERREIVYPSVAYRNSATAVVGIVRPVWTIAPPLHVGPYLMFRSANEAMLKMLLSATGRDFSHEASTTTRRSSDDAVPAHSADRPAFAFAEWLSAILFKDRPSVFHVKTIQWEESLCK